MTHEIDCGVDRFWELFWDREFSKAMFVSLGFPKWEIVDQKETDQEIVRIIEAVPKLDMPAAVAKVLGPGFGYREEGRLDKSTKRFRFVITPSTLQGKLKNEGTMRVEPHGDGKCRRIVVIVAEAKVFGIGGMLESMTEKNLREGWAAGARFTNDWLKTHP